MSFSSFSYATPPRAVDRGIQSSRQVKSASHRRDEGLQNFIKQQRSSPALETTILLPSRPPPRRYQPTEEEEEEEEKKEEEERFEKFRVPEPISQVRTHQPSKLQPIEPASINSSIRREELLLDTVEDDFGTTSIGGMKPPSIGLPRPQEVFYSPSVHPQISVLQPSPFLTPSGLASSTLLSLAPPLVLRAGIPALTSHQLAPAPILQRTTNPTLNIVQREVEETQDLPDIPQDLMESILWMNEQIRSLYEQQIALMDALITTEGPELPTLHSPAASMCRPQSISRNAASLLRLQKQKLAQVSQIAQSINPNDDINQYPQEYANRTGLSKVTFSQTLGAIEEESNIQVVVDSLIEVMKEGSPSQISLFLMNRSHLIEHLPKEALHLVFKYITCLIRDGIQPGKLRKVESCHLF